MIRVEPELIFCLILDQNDQDISLSTRISGSKWVKPGSSKFRTMGTARTK